MSSLTSDRATLKMLAKLPAAKGQKKIAQFAEVLIDDMAKLERDVKKLEHSLKDKADKLHQIKDLFRRQTENAKEHEKLDNSLLKALGQKDKDDDGVFGEGVVPGMPDRIPLMGYWEG